MSSRSADERRATSRPSRSMLCISSDWRSRSYLLSFRPRSIDYTIWICSPFSCVSLNYNTTERTCVSPERGLLEKISRCHLPGRMFVLPEGDVPWHLHNKKIPPFQILGYSKCEDTAPSSAAALSELHRSFPCRLWRSFRPRRVCCLSATCWALERR